MEVQTCFGPSVVTQSLHNAQIGAHDPNVYRQFANSWFRKYILKVSAPAGWHFTGEPFVHCIQNNQGAFEWNNFPGSHDRFYVSQRNPNYIECVCWAGSHDMTINLGCQADNKKELTYLNEDEITSMRQSKAENKVLPIQLEEKIKSLVEDFEKQKTNEDDICCNYYSNGDRYIKTSKQNCDVIGGTVVDPSACAS